VCCRRHNYPTRRGRGRSMGRRRKRADRGRVYDRCSSARIRLLPIGQPMLRTEQLSCCGTRRVAYRRSGIGRVAGSVRAPLPPWHFRPVRRCSIIFDVGASTCWTSKGHAYCDVLDRMQENCLPLAPPAWPWIGFCVGTGSGRYRLGNRKKNIT
jgi:hypothetical protein